MCDEEDSGLSDEEQKRKGPKNRPKHTRKRKHQDEKNFLEKFKTVSYFIVEQNWFAKIRNAVETSHCGVSPTEGMLYVFVCECLADAFRDATM